MEQESLQDLFIEQIRDLYDAEKQLVKALPKLAKAAQSEELVSALQNHAQVTETHVSRLEQVFKIAGVTAKAKTCNGIKGIIDEGNTAAKEEDKGALRDLAIIAGGQRVEHYEIAAYGTVRTMAEQLGMDDAVDLLRQTEDEEKQADDKLTEVATSLYQTAKAASTSSRKTRHA